MKRSLSERLFSISRSPYRTVVRFLFLKFTFKDRELDPERLQRTSELEYPRLLKKWYGRMTGEVLDLEHPRTFNQKMQWIKLYWNRELMTRLADKIAVRDYVSEKIGERYLVPLVGVYKNASEIDWDGLPSRFVLKPNHGSHWLEIVEDRNLVERTLVSKRADSWLEKDYSFSHGFEMQYHGIKPRLMIERHLGEWTHNLTDYKVWCFGGEPHYVQLVLDRFEDTGSKTAYYSADWIKQPFWKQHAHYEGEIPRPEVLDELLACSRKLAEGIPFVRVDFYLMDDGSLRFGEMTFTPSSGCSLWQGDPTADVVLGDLVKLPCDAMRQ